MIMMKFRHLASLAFTLFAAVFVTLCLAVPLPARAQQATEGAPAPSGSEASTGSPASAAGAVEAGANGSGSGPVLSGSPTQAATPDYAQWAKVAARAQEAIDADRASTVALENLRAQLSEWRTRFQSATRINTTRISTLRAQIAALGPVPGDGQGSEPAEIANRRAELALELAQAQAPGLIAQESFGQAGALIGSIDKLIRDRTTTALFELGPTPLNPSYWRDAFIALGGSARSIWLEVSGAIGKPSQAAQFRENLPSFLITLALAALLLLRGRPWLIRLNRFVQSTPRVSNGALVFIISLGQILLPFLGLLALISAIYDMGIVGLRGASLMTVMPQAALAFMLSRWLGWMIFPAIEPEGNQFALSTEQRSRGRWAAVVIGFVYAVLVLLSALADYEVYTPETRAVLSFPVFVLGALALFAIGRLLVARARLTDKPGEERPYRDRLTLWFGRAIMAIAVIGPVMSAIGYGAAGAALLFPAFQTAALLAGLFVLQQFTIDLYALYTRDRVVAQRALVPVLMGSLLWVAATPVMALIWGARVADLGELWIKFRDGFDIGATRVSPTVFLTFAVIFAIGYAITRLVQGTLRNSILPRTEIDIGGRNAITSFVGYIGVFLAAVIGITSAGIDLSSLAIVAGALSVGIGFGLQNIVSNFVSGIILLIERPISEGDWIEVGGNMGHVRDISVRSTRIETFDRTDVIVPNADLVSGTVVNYTRGNLVGRVIVPVGVAYGTDTRQVEAILRDIAEAHPQVLLKPAPGVVFRGFGASSLDFEIRAILRDVNFSLSTRSEINHEIARRFAEEGIEIPFPQTDLWLRNAEALRKEDDQT